MGLHISKDTVERNDINVISVTFQNYCIDVIGQIGEKKWCGQKYEKIDGLFYFWYN